MMHAVEKRVSGPAGPGANPGKERKEGNEGGKRKPFPSLPFPLHISRKKKGTAGPWPGWSPARKRTAKGGENE